VELNKDICCAFPFISAILKPITWPNASPSLSISLKYIKWWETWLLDYCKVDALEVKKLV